MFFVCLLTLTLQVRREPHSFRSETLISCQLTCTNQPISHTCLTESSQPLLKKCRETRKGAPRRGGGEVRPKTEFQRRSYVAAPIIILFCLSQFHWFLVIVPRPCHLSELTTNKAWLDLGLTRISISMILLSLKFPILGMCVVYWYIIICRILIIQNLQNTCGKLWNVFVDKRRQNYYYSWAGTILCR